MAATQYLVGTTDTNWGTITNWSTGAAPASTDSTYLDQRATKAIDSGLAQSAVVLANLYLSLGLTQLIGTATTPLAIGVVAAYLGTTPNTTAALPGTTRFNADFGTGAATIYVLGGNTTCADSGLEATRFKCVNSSTKIYATAGIFGVATSLPADVATFGELDIAGSAQANLSSGVTWTTIKQANTSKVNLASGGTTFNQIGGTMKCTGTGAITTLIVGGRVTFNMRPASGAAVTTCTILPGGILDVSQIPSALTITTLNIWPGGTLIVNAANPTHLTITNQIVLQNCGTLSAA